MVLSTTAEQVTLFWFAW